MNSNPIRWTMALPLEIDLGNIDWEPISEGARLPVWAEPYLGGPERPFDDEQRL